MTTFGLFVNNKFITADSRGALLSFVESYYVKRAGFEKVAVNNWELRKNGETVSRVKISPVGAKYGQHKFHT